MNREGVCGAWCWCVSALDFCAKEWCSGRRQQKSCRRRDSASAAERPSSHNKMAPHSAYSTLEREYEEISVLKRTRVWRSHTFQLIDERLQFQEASLTHNLPVRGGEVLPPKTARRDRAHVFRLNLPSPAAPDKLVLAAPSDAARGVWIAMLARAGMHVNAAFADEQRRGEEAIAAQDAATADQPPTSRHSLPIVGSQPAASSSDRARAPSLDAQLAAASSLDSLLSGAAPSLDAQLSSQLTSSTRTPIDSVDEQPPPPPPPPVRLDDEEEKEEEAAPVSSPAAAAAAPAASRPMRARDSWPTTPRWENFKSGLAQQHDEPGGGGGGGGGAPSGAAADDEEAARIAQQQQRGRRGSKQLRILEASKIENANVIKGVISRQFAKRKNICHPASFRSTPPTAEEQRLSDYGRIRFGGNDADRELRALPSSLRHAECAVDERQAQVKGELGGVCGACHRYDGAVRAPRTPPPPLLTADTAAAQQQRHPTHHHPNFPPRSHTGTGTSSLQTSSSLLQAARSTLSSPLCCAPPSPTALQKPHMPPPPSSSPAAPTRA